MQDFRNYNRWETEPDTTLTVLVGPNAIGKTNVIEAIQLVATGASFRNPKWDELVRWGADGAGVSLRAEGDGSKADVDLTISASGTHGWRVGGIVKRRTADATKFVPAVIFTPDDLALAKGPAEQRRSAIDALGEQLSATYGALRRDYARVVRQRNALLRDEGPASALAAWDAQLVALGSRLHVHRRRLVRRVAEAAAPIYAHMARAEDLQMRVCDRCGIGELGTSADIDLASVETALGAELSRRSQDERTRRVSLAGPHRDDIMFLVGGKDARVFASQGQQRTIALAWKWAEVAIITEMTGRRPVLLLDDVMSELDQTRRAALTELVQENIQTFMTATTTDYFDPALLKEARVLVLGGSR